MGHVEIPMSRSDRTDFSSKLELGIARTLDDLMQVIALRAVAYVGEQRCPYAEEFDGNDFAGATHIVARLSGEPIATGRMRWFANFAKAERAAVLPAYRGSQIALAMMQAGIELASRKGYRRILGHVEPGLIPFWSRLSEVTVRDGRPNFSFSDRSYAEILIDVPQHPNPVTIDSEPLAILRPEGDWDTEGVLDRSIARMTRLAG